jgi:hypothetical protein
MADCQIDHTDMIAPWVADEEKAMVDAERLWKMSEVIVGKKFKY